MTFPFAGDSGGFDLLLQASQAHNTAPRPSNHRYRQPQHPSQQQDYFLNTPVIPSQHHSSAYNFSNDYSNNYQGPYDNPPNYGLSVDTDSARGQRLGASIPDFSNMLSMDPSSMDYYQPSSPSPAQKVKAVQPPPTVPLQTGPAVILRPVSALKPASSGPDKENGIPGKRKRGTGAKSGVGNRRSGGTSDDEIEKLDSKAVRGAALKVPEVKDEEDEEKVSGRMNEDQKERLVAYITDEKRWANWRVNQAPIFNHIANVILDGTVTWKQVKTYFLTHAWAKYKACRELIKHTGGGDGDQGRHNPGSDAEDENVSEEETKKLRAKRKKEGKSNWSDETLQKFMKSKIYKMIDKVAHDDSSVIPPRVFGSTEDISDDDTTDDTPKQAKKRHHGESSPDASTQGLMEAVRSITKKSKTQEQIALANLEIARRREEREQLEREERLALLKRREEREEQELADRREAIRREIRAAEEAKRDKQWEQAMIMLDSPHEAIQNEGKRRIAELNAQTAAK